MTDPFQNQMQQQLTPNEVPLENQVAEWKRKAEEARLEAEQARRDSDMLRESQLRMMAQQPLQQPPIQEPVESEEEINNLFSNSPAQAVNRIVDRKAKDIDKIIEQRARQIFATEAKKIEAVTRFPELRNPNSEFFKKVAYYMDTHPYKYNEPEGIIDACARVQLDIGSPSNIKDFICKLKSFSSNADAIVDLPAPESPVNQITVLLWLFNFSRSERVIFVFCQKILLVIK